MARKNPNPSSTSTPSKPSSSSTTSKSSHQTPSKPSYSSTKATPSSSTNSTSSGSAGALSSKSSPQEIALHIWNQYLQDTPPRTFWLDAFMAFLVVIGGLQFLYAVLFGNYPFNAFLSGFSAAVGQFVLLVSLRLQTSEQLSSKASSEAKRAAAKNVDAKTGETIVDGDASVSAEGGVGEAGRVSSERAFADFVFGSLLLHGFCVNFIN